MPEEPVKSVYELSSTSTAESFENAVTHPLEVAQRRSVLNSDTLERLLREHSAFVHRELKFYRKVRAPNSELVEYRVSGGPYSTVVLKHILGARSDAAAEQAITREFTALTSIQTSCHQPFLETVPSPIILLAGVHAMLITKLPGSPLKSVLRLNANAICGPLRCRHAGEIGQSVGFWLRSFHLETRKPSVLHNHQLFMDEFVKWLQRCEPNGFNGVLLEQLLRSTTNASKRAVGRSIPAAAGHGDFIPDNILLDKNRIYVVDFQNFSECDVIYKDIASFSTYLMTMAARSVYHQGTLQNILHNFLRAYGVKIHHDLLALYGALSFVKLAAQSRFRVLAFPRGHKLLENLIAQHSHKLSLIPDHEAHECP